MSYNRSKKTNRFTCAADRRRSQPSVEDCVHILGVAIDPESAISITAFCNVNGFDVALVAFEIQKELDDFE